jgi:MFS family permease
MNDKDGKSSLVVNPGFYYGYIVVIAGFVITMVSVGTYYSIGVFFKPMLNDFGWSRAVTSGPISFSMITNGLLVILMGRITDKFGPRLVGIICAVLGGTGYLLMSQITAVWQLYLYYGLFIGAGTTIFLPLLSTVARWFVKSRTVMTGIVVTGGGIGGLYMPLVMNWLISTYNWRTAFIIMGAAVLTVILIASLFLRRHTSGEHQLPERLIENGHQPPQGFTLGESVRTGQFWLTTCSFFCFGYCLNTVMIHLVPHITDTQISSTSAAGILSTLNGMSIVGNVLLGIVADKIGNKRLFIVTFILEGILLFWMLIINQIWAFFVFAALFGLAIGGAIPQESPLVARVFGIRSHGVNLSVISLGHSLGGAAGGLLAGYIFDLSGNYQLVFLVCVLACIIGMLATLIIQPVIGRKVSMPSPTIVSNL